MTHLMTDRVRDAETVISGGDYEATVTGTGAALKSLEVAGRELLDTFERSEENPDARGQVLLPFPNRVEDGRYVFEGKESRLPIDEPERGHAIHGLTRWKEWSLSRRTKESATLRHDLLPQQGYPFSLDLRMTYELSASGLTVTTTATNEGDGPLPFGAGCHPYFTIGATADEAVLRVPAASHLKLDERLIPVSLVAVGGSGLDFREKRGIGTQKINACFTDLAPDDDGRVRIVLSHPDGKPEITVWMDGEHRYVQIYTGDDIPDASRRRQSVAIEPMTCAPNAFNTGEGLRILEPGETFTGAWGVCVSNG